MKQVVNKVVNKIAITIAGTAAFKQLATKLGVSVGTSATGVGIPIALVLIQGTLQRSSLAAQRLKRKNATLYSFLQQENLQYLYFLLEKPMEKYIDAANLAEQNLPLFQQSILNLYKLN
ncbi:hypothetical protein HZU77_003870 [Neisseriaceae bacterium TC5R-5]|nr:hypothetical protein [Neisseriaceae bacterium TC5R-5]